MKINEITDDLAVGFYLAHIKDHGFITTKSTHIALLEDARKFTNRDHITGNVLSNDPALVGSWLGNLGYLVLLDQIGSAICLKGRQDFTTKPNFIKTLEQFSTLKGQECNALYCLRNSFAHDYSLTNKGRRPEYFYRFSLKANEHDPMIILPDRMWDGNYKTSYDNMITRINLWALGDFIEEVIRKIRNECDKNNLEINVRERKDELLSRFMIAITK